MTSKTFSDEEMFSPALRNGKATFDEIMEPFFFTAKQDKGFCTEMRLFVSSVLVVTWGSVDL